jgi:hypothetical protein
VHDGFKVLAYAKLKYRQPINDCTGVQYPLPKVAGWLVGAGPGSIVVVVVNVQRWARSGSVKQINRSITTHGL